MIAGGLLTAPIHSRRAGVLESVVKLRTTKKSEMPSAPSSPPSISGLGDAEVKARQAAEGFNELPRPDKRTALRIVLEVLREPMLARLASSFLIKQHEV